MPANRRNYYRVLHVQPDAPAEVIKAAYRALMTIHHPDKGGDANKASLVNEAYTVLADTKRRAGRVRELLRTLGQRDERMALTHRYAEAMSAPVDLDRKSVV